MGLRNMVRRNHLSDEVMGVYKKIFEEFGMGESGPMAPEMIDVLGANLTALGD